MISIFTTLWLGAWIIWVAHKLVCLKIVAHMLYRLLFALIYAHMSVIECDIRLYCPKFLRHL